MQLSNSSKLPLALVSGYAAALYLEFGSDDYKCCSFSCVTHVTVAEQQLNVELVFVFVRLYKYLKSVCENLRV